MRSAPDGHAFFERGSGAVLGRGVRRGEAAVAVVGRPVELVPVIGVIHGVLRLISRGIDIGEILGHFVSVSDVLTEYSSGSVFQIC